MTPPPGNTPTRPIRVDPALWERFGVATEKLGVDRSTYLREVMRWVVREPGAKPPKRPPAEELATRHAAE